MTMVVQTEVTRLTGEDASWSATKMTTTDSFLRTGKSNCEYNGDPVIATPIEEGNAQRDVFVVRSNMLYHVGVVHLSDRFKGSGFVPNYESEYLEDRASELEFGSPSAVIVPSSKSRQAFMIILDGDEGGVSDSGAELVAIKDFKLSSTVSYCCIAQLMGLDGADDRDRDKAVEAIASGKIKVLDSNPEVTRDVTARQASTWNRLEKKKNKYLTIEKRREAVKPPDRGFTLISRSGKLVWHRSSTVLLKLKQETWMVGQDEGTYFGVALMGRPSSVADAFTSLIPKDLRRTKGMLRQGEWFAVPVETVPDDCLCTMNLDSNVILPKDDIESNDHILAAPEGKICKSGVYVRNFSLCHAEHVELNPANKDQWYTLRKNTAKRSVSMDGVD